MVGAYAYAAPRAGAAFLLSSAGLIYLSLLVPDYIRTDWSVPFALSGVPCLLVGLLLRRQLDRAVLTDPLTGLANRRGLDARFGDQVARARRDGVPLCLLLADVDHFKQINDRFGHHVGDRVLREVADVITACVRSVDIVVRLGGEEIAVVLVADQAQLREIAERIRRRVEEDITAPGATVSVGGSWCRPDSGDEALLDSLVQQADTLMYEAKRAGRNRVALPALAP